MVEEITTVENGPGTAETRPASIGAPTSIHVGVLIARLGKLPATGALLMPVVWSLALAWWSQGRIDGWTAVLALLGQFCLALAFHLAGHYLDYRRWLALDGPAADSVPLPVISGSFPIWDGFHLLRSGHCRPRTVLDLAGISLSIYVLSQIWLTLLAGWPMLFFAFLSLVCLAFYLLPSIRYGNRWWVVDDLAVLLGLGLLPGWAIFYAQTGTLNALALVGVITPAVLGWLSLASYAFLSWRRDWRLQKRTMVVALGARRARDLAALTGSLAYLVLVLAVAFQHLPLSMLLVLVTLPAFLRAFGGRTDETPISPEQAREMVRRAAVAAIQTGLLSGLILWLSR